MIHLNVEIKQMFIKVEKETNKVKNIVHGTKFAFYVKL